MFWGTFFAILSFVGVVAAKYYTASEYSKLRRRLEEVKYKINKKKNEFKLAENKKAEAQAEEKAHEERIRFIKEVINGIRIQINQPDASVLKDPPNVSASQDTQALEKKTRKYA